MSVSLRSAALVSQPHKVFFRKRRKETPPEDILKGRLTKPFIGQVSADLLTLIFLNIRKNIWYAVLPSEEQNGDISSGARQRWYHIMRILLHTGLLEQNGDKVVVMTKNGTCSHKTCSSIRKPIL